MGYDVNRFQAEIDEELICPICSGVLEEPLHAPQCEHAFCKSCISKWLINHHNCPIDQQSITPGELKPVPRIIRNLLSHLRIMCDNANYGCTVVMKLECLAQHCKECGYNPQMLISCEDGCGLVIPRIQLKEHNCIKEMKTMLENQKYQISELQCSINEIKKDAAWKQKNMLDLCKKLICQISTMQHSIDGIRKDLKDKTNL